MSAVAQSASVQDVELDLLLEGMHRQYGFDFRNYARPWLTRRVRNFMREQRIETISLLQNRVLHDRNWMDQLLYALSVNVSAMFRDPQFYLAFRREVVPLLKTYPFIRIWLAGVSMGEEVYSLAILLREECVQDRCRIYATDVNDSVLKRAKDGIYPLRLMQAYTSNYIKAGGTRSFSDYYTASYDHVILKSWLRENVIFAQHNLASDSSFNEFHVILCRNVMIYFNGELQAHVYRLLHNSLVMFGVLGLGAKEKLSFSPLRHAYQEIDSASTLYRRVA